MIARMAMKRAIRGEERGKVNLAWSWNSAPTQSDDEPSAGGRKGERKGPRAVERAQARRLTIFHAFVIMQQRVECGGIELGQRWQRSDEILRFLESSATGLHMAEREQYFEHRQGTMLLQCSCQQLRGILVVAVQSSKQPRQTRGQ